jgi:hypothetical protein
MREKYENGELGIDDIKNLVGIDYGDEDGEEGEHEFQEL